MATDGPAIHCHSESPRHVVVGQPPRRRLRIDHAEAVEDDVAQATRVVEPHRAVDPDPRQQRVDDPGALEQEEKRDADRHRAGDRREVEHGAEEPATLQHPVVDDQREAERERRHRRHEHRHVVHGVAHADREVLAQERVLGEHPAVVVQADEVEVGERVRLAVPVEQAHPQRHQDRGDEEHEEHDDDRRHEQPTRSRPRARADADATAAARRPPWRWCRATGRRRRRR